MLRVLVIAGRGRLAWVDQEADAWEGTAGLEVIALRRNVTLSGVLKMFNRGYAWDGVVLLGHGNDHGFELASGDWLPRGMLAQMMRGRTKHVVLNTCSSEAAAELYRDEVGVDVICTISDVDDQAAYVTGAVLAARLGEGHDFRQAYALSKPAEGNAYRYLAALPEPGGGLPSAAPFRGGRT